MFMRKTIGILCIVAGILGLLLVIWEFRVGVWLVALSPNSEPFSYGGVGILAVISTALIILGFYLQNHSIPVRLPFARSNTGRRAKHYIPKSPFRILASTMLGLASIVGTILSIQGFCAYFIRDFRLPYDGYELFNAIDMPIAIRGITLWAATLGDKTWITPLVMLIASIWLFSYSRFNSIISKVLSKIQP